MNSARKITGFGKAVKIISRVVSILLFLGFLSLLICSIVMFAIPGDVFSLNVDIKADMTVGGVLQSLWSELVGSNGFPETLSGNGADLAFNANGLTGSVNNIVITPGSLAGYVMLASVGVLLLSAAFYFAAGFGKTVQRNGDLLADDSIKALRNTTVVFLIWSVGCMVLNLLYGILTSYFISGSVNIVRLNISSGSLVVIALFMLLTGMIKHTALRLKSESSVKSDEQYSYYNGEQK